MRLLHLLKISWLLVGIRMVSWKWKLIFQIIIWIDAARKSLRCKQFIFKFMRTHTLHTHTHTHEHQKSETSMNLTSARVRNRVLKSVLISFIISNESNTAATAHTIIIMSIIWGTVWWDIWMTGATLHARNIKRRCCYCCDSKIDTFRWFA